MFFFCVNSLKLCFLFFLLSIPGCCCVCSVKSSVGFLIILMQLHYFNKKKKGKIHKNPLLYLKMCPTHMSHIKIHNFIQEVSKELKDKYKIFLQVVSRVLWRKVCQVWVVSGGWTPFFFYPYCNSVNFRT